MKFTLLEREFINQFQGNFPLQSRPFLIISKRLDCTENKLIDITERLIAKKIITRFGPLYDAVKLGGGLTLAALCVPEHRYREVTEIVNACPEVAHNYRREHKLNMWFVLATEKPEQINTMLHSIEYMTRLPVFDFPKQHEFYVGLWLHLYKDGQVITVPVPEIVTKTSAIADTDYCIDETDKKIIQQTQAGLDIVERPYLNIASTLGLEEIDVLQRLQRMLEHGVIRRIGIVPNHYKLGLIANGMSVWKLNKEHLFKMGGRIGQLDFVSHCYQRPAHLPLWPYNFFAMVHAHTRQDVDIKIKQIENMLGTNCYAHDVLFSTEILKKTGLRLAA